ncbi:unnamed protein product [Malus baccata var. baccata]
MQDEYNALISTGTWSLVPSHPSQNIVGCKWVFRVKKKADGTIDRYKTCLVAKGFHQQEVAKQVTIRILLTLAVQYNWFLNQLDISNAFLHGDLNEDVYMPQPPEFVDPNSPSHFPVKDLGPLHYFLGLEVHRSSQGIFLHQTKYLLDLLKKTNMEGAKPCCTSLSSKKLDHSVPLLSNPTKYRSIVGGLQYLTWTISDLAFTVNQICQFTHTPREQHLQAAKRVLRFLKGSLSHGSNLISWSAKKQSTVARSSTEAEYRSLAHTAAELTWVCKILRDLHFPLPTLPQLWCDNISTLSLASNPVLYAHIMHVEIDYHYIRELVLANLFKVQFVCCDNQLANLHTKSLSKSRFHYLCSKLPIGISSNSPSSLKGCIRENDKSSISVPIK